MKYEKIQEGEASFFAPAERKISRSLPVFYNPVMRFNRDVSILLLNSSGMEDILVGLPLAGTGVRGIRFEKELLPGVAREIRMNDYSQESVRLMKRNIRHNSVSIAISRQDANLFLLESSGFDYIDIDPFGSPNPYLDSAIKRLSRGGILAITATDTAPLCGTYPNACKRKYWAVPKRDYLMYETGLRILIRKIQLIGAQYDKALIPIFSYFRHHYFRVFLRCIKGKKGVDRIMKMHGDFNQAGPLWLGDLWDKELAELMYDKCDNSENKLFLRIIKDESVVPVIGYFDAHTLAKKNRSRHIPKKRVIISEILNSGYKVSETHFLKTGIRSNIPLRSFENIINLLLA